MTPPNAEKPGSQAVAGIRLRWVTAPFSSRDSRLRSHRTGRVRVNAPVTPQEARLRRLSFITASLCALLALESSPAAADPVITAAGDIAVEDRPAMPQKKTSALIARIDPRAVLTLGDNQYPDGELEDFRSSYDPTWGQFRFKTYPSTGNHEYITSNARGYFRYFGRRAHRRHGGYYAFEVGRWHLIAVNSGRGYLSSTQMRWVKRNLRRDDARCELVYWHHPLWSSGVVHGSYAPMRSLWRVLFRAGVDVVLNGHEHNYERFAPMRPSGEHAPIHGIREFVVGTGGASTSPFGRAIRNSQRRISRYGVLKMTLSPQMYRWAFIRGDSHVMDHGRFQCHR
jgi:acid phosphatase type 7